MKSRALWHLSNQQTEIKKSVLPERQDQLYKVKALFSLISLGTERLVAMGKVPVDLFESMKVPYMEGTFDLPLKYGYSLVGEIESGTDELNGQIVHLLHPHQDCCFVNRADFTLVPSGIPAQRATLVSNLETALNVIWDAKVGIGDRVAVVGFGAIGALLCRLLHKIPGIDLQVYEINPYRQSLIESWGFSLGNSSNVLKSYDITFNCSSSEEGLQFCLDHTGFEGKVVELSWYGQKPVSIQLGKFFHNRRLQLISSQVSQIPTDRRPRWDYARRKEVVFRLLQDSSFDLHITHTIPFEQAPALFNELRSGPVDGIGYCLTY